METRIVTPAGVNFSDVPGNNARLATDDEVKNLIGGVQKRTIQPPPGVLVEAVPHPVSKQPSWAAIMLPSEYRSRGWVFFDAAIIEGDIRFGRSERALLIKRLNHPLGTFMLHRQAWIFGVDNLDDQTQELRKMKNTILMEIVTTGGYTPKEYKSAITSLAAAMDKALHNMSFWDNEITLKNNRKKWEVGVSIEQVGENLADDGSVVHRTEEVI